MPSAQSAFCNAAKMLVGMLLRDCIAPRPKAGLGTVALEAFILALYTTGEITHTSALFGRYGDLSLIDDEIEASFLALRNDRLAGR